jgi:hypothetical protein
VQLTGLLLVVKALLLIGLTQISLTKSGFNHPSAMESPLWLLPPVFPIYINLREHENDYSIY